VGNLLIYDAKGSLRKKLEVDWNQLSLDKGKHTLRVSCDFNTDSDLVLKGMIKLKDKTEVIIPQ
jgi:hypothetical protein